VSFRLDGDAHRQELYDFNLTFVPIGACRLTIRDRKAERRADIYAFKLGYGEDMVNALYLLEKISLSSNASIIEKLLASHPRLTSRIEALEIQLGIQQNDDYIIYSKLSTKEIFDALKGKTYGQTWDILDSCSKEIVEKVAKNCPHDNGKSVAKIMLGQETAQKRLLIVAPLTICCTILLAVTAFLAPMLIFREPKPIENILDLAWSETNNFCVGRVDGFTPPEGTSEDIINLLNTGGNFGVYVLSANVNEESSADRMVSAHRMFNSIYDSHNELGDPFVMDDRWLTDFNDIKYPSDRFLIILTPPINGGFPSGEDDENILKNGEQVIVVYEDGTMNVAKIHQLIAEE
jgi:hypothetical protein